MDTLFEFLNLRTIRIWDVFDILIVWFLIYSIFRFIQGSRAMQMALGLLALFLAQIVSVRLNLVVLSKIIGSLFAIIPIAIIVLFQDEIRRVLASLGRSPFARTKSANSSEIMVTIAQAAIDLAKKRTGALIVFEREESLKTIMDSGTYLDAATSYELLVDIFQNKGLLHDGALIVSKSRIASAACVLPLSRNSNLPKFYGTRHRAAIGISEETDCVALIVSEERGKVSFAIEGEIYTLAENSTKHFLEIYHSLVEDDELSTEQGWRDKLVGLWYRFRQTKAEDSEQGEVS